MKSSDDKICEALKLALDKRTDNLGSKIAKGVKDNIQELRELDMTEAELKALKCCYETSYQDSKESLQSIIALMGIDISKIAGIFAIEPILEKIFREIFHCSDYILLLQLVFIGIVICLGMKIRKRIVKIDMIPKDNASFRNYAMAVSVLLAEKISESQETADTQIQDQQ